MGGGHRQTIGLEAVRDGKPPTLTLPHKGGGDYTFLSTGDLLLFQRRLDRSSLLRFTSHLHGGAL